MGNHAESPFQPPETLPEFAGGLWCMVLAKSGDQSLYRSILMATFGENRAFDSDIRFVADYQFVAQ